ncbi:MAG: hypothetical protein ACRD4S_08355 [Candidatus Acidiferrales bacterium]
MLDGFGIAMRLAALVLAGAFLFCSGAFARQDRITKLQSRYDGATDPVHKARDLQPLGHAQFKQIEELAAAGNFNDALAKLKQYRDEAQETLKALDAKGVNAEKHPNGFKQLEFSIREALRRLDGILVTLAGDEQRPFRKIREQLVEMDGHLLHELFPLQPSPNGAARN